VVVGGFNAVKKHCSYYPFSGSTLKTLKAKLSAFKQTKSALHFPHDKPLSRSLVKLIVSTRLAEIDKNKRGPNLSNQDLVVTAVVEAYTRGEKPQYSQICHLLAKEIRATLPKGILKLYHGLPVWFIGENAVVGFYITANKGVNLLFWNGQALEEPELKATGKFKAAQIRFQVASEINVKNLRR
jgi:hypothetical protein